MSAAAAAPAAAPSAEDARPLKRGQLVLVIDPVSRDKDVYFTIRHIRNHGNWIDIEVPPPPLYPIDPVATLLHICPCPIAPLCSPLPASLRQRTAVGGSDLWSANGHAIPGTQAMRARNAADAKLARSGQNNPPGKTPANPVPKKKKATKQRKAETAETESSLRTIIVQLVGAPTEIVESNVYHTQQSAPRVPHPTSLLSSVPVPVRRVAPHERPPAPPLPSQLLARARSQSTSRG